MFDLNRNGFNPEDVAIDAEGRERFKLGEKLYRLRIRPALEPPTAAATPRPVSPVKIPDQPPTDGIYNVKDFGARGNGASDDTAAIQATIDRASAGGGGRVWVPPGRYPVASLNLTNRHGIGLVGAGALTTDLIAIKNDAHIIDMTGGMYLRLEDFSISTGEVTPAAALLIGQNATWSGNANHFSGLYISGKYRVATVYIHGSASSDMINCDLYNYQPTDAPVVILTGNNIAGVKSKFAQTMETAGPASDWTFTACEMHSFAAGMSGGSSKAPTVLINDASQLRWIGGNISGSGPEFVRIVNSGNWLIFQGTTFYSDNGTPASAAFRSDGTVDGLTVKQCVLGVSKAIFAGAPGAVWKNLDLASPCGPQYGGSTWLLDSPGGRLSDSILICNGMDLRADSVTHTLLLNPGEIQARIVEKTTSD